MSANGRFLRVGVAAIVLGGLVVLLLWWLRGDPPILPAPPNPFVKKFTLERMDDGQPLEGTLKLPVNTGFYAGLTLVPATNLPAVLEEREVADPARWPTTLFIYPRGSDRESEDALHVRCIKFQRPGEERPIRIGSNDMRLMPIIMGTTGYWSKESGFKGSPAPPKSRSKDELRFWTFIAVRKDQPPGEYVYEIIVYPTAAWVSAVRQEIGPPVVLQRGLLRVVAAAE